jgi:hypothetical protein
MKIIPIAKMDKVNTVISKTWLEVGEYRITANPYKPVKIKKIPSAYPNFLLKVDNSFLSSILIYEVYLNFITLGSVESFRNFHTISIFINDIYFILDEF